MMRREESRRGRGGRTCADNCRRRNERRRRNRYDTIPTSRNCNRKHCLSLLSNERMSWEASWLNQTRLCSRCGVPCAIDAIFCSERLENDGWRKRRVTRRTAAQSTLTSLIDLYLIFIEFSKSAISLYVKHSVI